MTKIVIFTLILTAFLACEKSASPIGQNVSVYFTGKVENELYEFRISNNLNKSVRYLGYNKGFPIFLISVLGRIQVGYIKDLVGVEQGSMKFYPNEFDINLYCK
jgi:hypothetical protein